MERTKKVVNGPSKTWKQPFFGLQKLVVCRWASLSWFCQFLSCVALNQSLETCGNPAVIENPGTSPTDPLKFFQLSIVCGDPKNSWTQQLLVGGWPTPLKIWKSVGVIIPNWMESHKIHIPNHQPDYKTIPKNDPESQSAKTLAAPPGLGFDIRPAQSWHRDGNPSWKNDGVSSMGRMTSHTLYMEK